MRTLLLLSFFAFAFLMACTDSNSKQNAQMASASEVMPETKENAKQLRHVVLFKFKESSTPEDIARVEAAFSALPSKIPQIKDYEWGTNNSPEGLDKGFTHCFFLTFDSEEDRAVYLPHPDHKAFGEVLGPHLEDVTVVDYWTN